jgi:hypothetical protein
MQEIWSPWFQLVRIPGVYLPGNGAAACKMSHRMIAAHFLQEQNPIIVMEDDNTPLPAFEKMGAILIEEAKCHCTDWDYVNLSPWLDLSVISMTRANLSPSPSPLFLKSNYSHNTNFVIYNRRSLYLLNTAMKNPLPLDVFLGWHAVDQWVPIKLLAMQDDSPSDIPKPNVNPKALYRLTEEMLEDAVNAQK